MVKTQYNITGKGKKQYDKWTVITKMLRDQLVIFTRLHSPSSQPMGGSASQGQITKVMASVVI